MLIRQQGSRAQRPIAHVASRSAVAAAGLTVLLLTGCADTGTSPERTQAAEGSFADGEDLVAALGEIDPGLGDEASIADADELCLDIQEGQDDAALAESARSLFEDQASGELTDDQVGDVVETVKTTYCG